MEKKKTRKKKISSIQNIIYMTRLIHRSYKGRLAYGIGSNILNKVCDVILFVYFVQYIFESVENGRSFHTVASYLTVLVCMEIVIKAIVAVYERYYTKITDPYIYQYIYEKVVDKASKLPLYYYENTDYYDKYQKAIDEAKTNATNMVTNLSEMLGSLFGIMVIIYLIVRNDPVVLIFAVTPMVIVVFVNGKLSNALYNRKNALVKDKRRADYSKRLFYEKKFANEVRLYPLKGMFFHLHEKAYANMKKIYRKHNIKIVGIEIPYKLLIQILVMTGASLYITYQITTNHRMSAGAYASLLVAVYQFNSSIKNFMSNISDIVSNAKYAQNLIDFLDTDEERKVQGKENVPDKFHTLEFQDVSYAYYGSEKKALNHLNFSISNGEKIALVGYNGAGKTTLVKLMLSLYDVTDGKILYNGQDIRGFDSKSYKEQFAVLFQDFQLYALPIATNVLMRTPTSKEDRDRVVLALKHVKLWNKVSQLADGIDTMLTHEFDKNGLQLSGGESQKMAIARVFANVDAEIAILDEPSSALDPISEFEVYQNIMNELKDKTVIFISHRLSTARLADHIYMLDSGGIVEEGTHEQLLELGGKYAEMFRVQAKKYTEEYDENLYLELEGGQ